MNEIINLGSGAKVKVTMLKGEAGNDIQSIEKTSTEGLVDTYTITLTDGTTHTFEVTNGRAILSIEKTSSQGYVDTYTITFNDGTTMDVQFEKATITVDDALSDTSTNPVENKAITKEVESLKDSTRTNLLNPTLQTQTVSGVTCTNNGDGTYTLNGTASQDHTRFYLLRDMPIDGLLTKGKTYLLLDGLTDTSVDSFDLQLALWRNGQYAMIAWGTKNGKVNIPLPSDKEYESFYLYVDIRNGQTLNNITFKPMLTTDLSATYDDFVRYSGAGELNENVADIYEDLKDAEADILANRSNFATIENGSTASQSYSVGSFLVLNGVLRKVTSAIAQGDTISNSNSEVVTVGGELSQINSDLTESLTPIPLTFTPVGGTTIQYNSSYRVGNMLYINLYVGLPATPTYAGKSILTLDNITLSKEHKAVACAMTTVKKWVDFSIFTNGTIQVGTVGDAIDSGDRVVISFVIPI